MAKDLEWVQVRLRRDTAEKLRDFAARLTRWAREHPDERQAFMDLAERRDLGFDLAVLTLLYRDDVKSQRSRQHTATKLAKGQRHR